MVGAGVAYEAGDLGEQSGRALIERLKELVGEGEFVVSTVRVGPFGGQGEAGLSDGPLACGILAVQWVPEEVTSASRADHTRAKRPAIYTTCLSRLVFPDILADLGALADAVRVGDAEEVYRKLSRLDQALSDMMRGDLARTVVQGPPRGRGAAQRGGSAAGRDDDRDRRGHRAAAAGPPLICTEGIPLAA